MDILPETALWNTELKQLSLMVKEEVDLALRDQQQWTV